MSLIALSQHSEIKRETVKTSNQDNLHVDSKNLLKSRESGFENVFKSGIFDSHKSLEFKCTYMENEEFLSKYCYGGGKRKSNDSDVDYNPNDGKKLKLKKKKRKYNRKSNTKRLKGKARSSQRIEAVKAANSKTNPKNNPKNNPKRSKGEARSLQRIEAVKAANSKTNPKRPGKKLHKYDESSIHPPTLNQFHDSGRFPANAKAAACALQPPDPSRTMVFMSLSKRLE